MEKVEKDWVRCRRVCPINCVKMNGQCAHNKCCEKCIIKMRAYQHGTKEAISMLKNIINIIKKLFAFILKTMANG